VDGRDIFVTSLHAIWTAIMDFAILQVAMEPTSASASLVGEERAATSADHTGDVQTRKMMLATTQMNVFVMAMKLTLRACAIMKF
jgi:hypothetical protein